MAPWAVVLAGSTLVSLATALLNGQQSFGVKTRHMRATRRPYDVRCLARMAGDDQLPKVEPGEEDVIGEIDWDSEWQKVMRGEQDSVSRPKEVTLELERAKRRAVRSTERMIEATRSKRDWLRQDARFYLLALAAISFVPVLLVALTSSSTGQYADTPYIV